MLNQRQTALKTLSGDLFEIIEVRENEAHQGFSLALCSSKGWEGGFAQFSP